MTPAAELLEQVLGPIVERAVARVLAKQPKPAPETKGGELTAKQIAADQGVSTSTIWRWRRAGTFIEPRRNPGGHVRFDRGEYESWKQKRDKVRLRS